MSTTLRDLANHLNLSPAVISRVLNDKPGRWASEETRRRILEAADSLDYRPSVSARALKTGLTHQIAVLNSDLARNREISRAPDLSGLIEVASQADYRVLVLPVHEGHVGAVQLENLLRDRVCDGICVFSDQLTEAQVKILQRYQIPFVVIGDEPVAASGHDVAGSVRVDFDNFELSYGSVKWLAEQRHRRIAYVMSAGEADQPHALALRAGFEAGIAEFCGGEPARYVPQIEDNLTISRVVAAGEVEAVLVRDLHNAIKWVSEVQKAGYRLREDFRVLALANPYDIKAMFMCGWGDMLACQSHDWYDCALRAGEILLSWIRGEVPEKSVHLVASPAPGWCQDVCMDLHSRILNRPVAIL